MHTFLIVIGLIAFVIFATRADQRFMKSRAAARKRAADSQNDPTAAAGKVAADTLLLLRGHMADAYARTDLLIISIALLLHGHPDRESIIAALKALATVQEKERDDPQYSAALDETLRRIVEGSGSAQPRDVN